MSTYPPNPLVRTYGVYTQVSDQAADLEARLAIVPGSGRSVTDIRTYLANNANFNIRDFGAVGDGTTDDASAFQAAINAAGVNGGTVVVPQGGRHMVRSPLNLSSTVTSLGITIRFEGANSVNAPVLIAAHTGHVFDCTGGRDHIFDGVNITGDSTTTPKTGWLLARDVSGGSASRHRFINCRARGYFSKAIVYSYASEENEYHGCWMENQQANAKVFVSTAYNIMALTSTFVTIASGAQSNIVTKFFGGSWQAAQGVTSDVFYLDGGAAISWYGPWMLCGGENAAGRGRSLIYVDATNSTSDFCQLHDAKGEEVGDYLHQQYGIYFGNEAVRVHSGWTVNGGKIVCGATTRTLTVGLTSGSPTMTSAGLFTANDVGSVISGATIGVSVTASTTIIAFNSSSSVTLSSNAIGTNASASVSLCWRIVFSAGQNITLDSSTFANILDDGRGMEFSSLQYSYVQSPLSALIIRNLNTGNTLIANSSTWSLGTRTTGCTMDANTGVWDTDAGYKVAGTRVLGTRATGWTVQTTTAARADMGASPSLATVASTLAALLADLRTHGVLGT